MNDNRKRSGVCLGNVYGEFQAVCWYCQRGKIGLPGGMCVRNTAPILELGLSAASQKAS